MFIDCLDDVFIDYQLVPSSGVSFLADIPTLSINKSFKLLNNQLQVIYRFTEKKVPHVFSTEINLAMPSCDGVGGHYSYHGEILGGFGQLLEKPNLTEIILEDDTLGGRVLLKASAAMMLRAQPHFTASQSEGGFEKIMQAVTLTLSWPITDQELIVTLEINARNIR